MGYRIDYQPYGHSKYTKKRRISVLMAILTVGIILVILGNVYPGSRAFLLEIIFPGDAALTTASINNMVAEMKAGTSFADAVRLFCRQVFFG